MERSGVSGVIRVEGEAGEGKWGVIQVWGTGFGGISPYFHGAGTGGGGKKKEKHESKREREMG